MATLVILKPFTIHQPGHRQVTAYVPGQRVPAKAVPWTHTPQQWLEKGLARWSWWTVAVWALMWGAA